jgi:ureidoglycolate lyase
VNAGGILARPIDAAAFAPFGQLLERPSAGVRQDFAADVLNERPASARANLALVRAEAASLPLSVDTMEHHPHSTQAFFPLDVEEYLVAVCHDDGNGAPDLATLAAFRVRGTQGISYRPRIWHVGMTTLGRPGTFAMLVHEDRTPADCVFRRVPAFQVLG